MDNRTGQAHDSQTKTAARKAVLLVWDEVRRYGGDAVEICVSSTQVVYRFVARDGRKGEGSVNSRYGSAIEATLMESLRLTLGVDSVQITGGSSGTYRLSLAKREHVTPLGVATGPNSSATLSLVKSSTNSEGTDESGQGNKSTTPIVLVVEDNPAFSKVLVRFLSRNGFSAVACADGLEGLSKLESGFTPNLIISDLHMPNLSGDELACAVRRIPALRNVPLMLLTSDRALEAELKALNAGADLFLAKSEDPRIIAAYAKRLIMRSGNAAHVAGVEATAA